MRHAWAITLTLVAGSAAQAQIDIRMDLSNRVSTTPGNWNNITDLTGVTSNLIDFHTGAGTGINIDGIGSPWQQFFGDDAGAFPDQDWLVQPAARDGAGLQAGLTGVFRLTGLPPLSYRIEVVSARSTFNYLNTITVGGAIADSTYKGTPVVTPWNSTTDGLGNANWLIWSSVFIDSGTIDIRDIAGPGTPGMINAIHISAIPAPGAALTLALGLAAATRRRR